MTSFLKNFLFIFFLFELSNVWGVENIKSDFSQDTLIQSKDTLSLKLTTQISLAGDELSKAAKHFYIGYGLIVVGVGGSALFMDRRVTLVGIFCALVGLGFSVEYMVHVGNAGKILNNKFTSDKGFYIQSNKDGLGLAYKF